MPAISRLGRNGIWVRANGSELRALDAHEPDLEPVLTDLSRREGKLTYALWEVGELDVDLTDTNSDQASRVAFAARHTDLRRVAVVPDVNDSGLVAPALQIIAGGMPEVEARSFDDRRDALLWLREFDDSVPTGVPVWRTSRPPPG